MQLKNSNLQLQSYLPIGLFAIALFTFIVLKIPHLKVPFFWDESGVYGKIIFQLADNQLSLHPKAINEWISRGHPLLYPNFIAAACKIFGTTVTVSHAANFLLAIILLISMYAHLAKAFHPFVGLVASVLLMALPLYFTQSVFVLPEIALALTLWWTTWAFINRKYLHYFLFGAAAMMIKEPAIIWIGSLFAWSLIFDRINFARKILWLTPAIPFIIFLLIQKQTFRWYLFPFHTDSFDFKSGSLFFKFKYYMVFLFWKQGKFLWAMIVLLGIIIYLFRKNKSEIKKYNRNYLAPLFAAFIYILFSCTSFIGERYIMPSIIIVCSMLGFLIYKVITRKNIPATLILMTLVVSLIFPYIRAKEFVYDNNMSYINSTELTKKTIRYMLDRGMLNQDEFFASMPVTYAISDARFGYLPKDTIARFNKIIHPGTKYAVHTEPGTQIENPGQYPLDTLVHWKDYDIKTTIYRVLPKDTSNMK
jgi:hypothetical protein